MNQSTDSGDRSGAIPSSAWREALLGVRQRNARNPARSGAAWSAYDLAVLDCIDAIEAVQPSSTPVASEIDFGSADEARALSNGVAPGQQSLPAQSEAPAMINAVEAEADRIFSEYFKSCDGAKPYIRKAIRRGMELAKSPSGQPV